jgi:ferrous iron transport protein A
MSPTMSTHENLTKHLSATKAGDVVHLVRIDAGRGLKSRLAAMGLATDTEIRVVSNGHPGPFVLIVKDTKVVLGRGVAQKVVVR